MDSKRTTQAGHRVPPPTRAKATQRDFQREALGRTEDWNFPTPQDRTNEDVGGKLYCPSCHAVSLLRRWFLDERQYEILKNDPVAQPVLCPGCSAAAREMYDGEIVLNGATIWRSAEDKQGALNLIRNIETSVRSKNPLARLASVEDRGDDIYILTITTFLAHRLVKEFTKAYGGHFEIDNLPDERFVRARWTAASAKPENLRKSEKHGRKRAA
jgi:hypothetical protein